MRIRVIRTPPPSYGIDGADLRVGRIYNLEWSLASALMSDGCAEFYDTFADVPSKEIGPRALQWPSRFADDASDEAAET